MLIYCILMPHNEAPKQRIQETIKTDTTVR